MEEISNMEVSKKLAEKIGYRVEHSTNGYGYLIGPDKSNHARVKCSSAEYMWNFIPSFCSSLDELKPVLKRIAADAHLSAKFDEALYELLPAGDYEHFGVADYLTLPTAIIARAALKALEDGR